VPSFLITLLLAAHLLAMNLASAGPVVGAWLARRPEPEGEHGRGVFRASLYALLVGSLLGGALIVWPSSGLRQALGRFPADAYWFGGLELLFSAACIAALAFGGAPIGRRRWIIGGLAIVSATNLLYHFPPLMAVLGELAADPGWAKEEVIDRATLLRLWKRPEILSLWAHFVLASITVACVAAMWPGRSTHRAVDGEAGLVERRLGAVALAASTLQIPVGLWLLGTRGAGNRDAILGGELLAVLLFAGGVLGALWLLQSLLAVTLGERGAISRATVAIIIVTVLMTATLRTARDGKTKPDAAAAEWPRTSANQQPLERQITEPALSQALSASPRACRRGACSA
jgi:hypothetical protein